MRATSESNPKFLLNPSLFSGSLLVGAVSGGVAGLVAGVLARIAMRIVAVVGGMTPGFSIGGTLGILVIVALFGMAPGLLYAVTLPIWQATPVRKGRVMGVILAVLIVVAFLSIDAEGELALIPVWITALMFGAIALVFGFVFGAVAGRLTPGAAAAAPDSTRFVRAAGLLAVVGGLVSGGIELFLAAAFPAAQVVGVGTTLFLEGLGGAMMALAIVAGLAGLLRSGAAGENRWVVGGLAAAFGGMLVLGLGSVFGGSGMIEIHGLVRVMSRLAFEPDLLILLVLLAALVLIVLAAGIAVLRAGAWTGWRRYTPLGVGLVPVLSVIALHPALLPALLDVSVFGRDQLGHWIGAVYGLTWLALGIAMRIEADR